MKFATSNYSFWKEYRSGKMTFMEIISKTKEMGFDAIEFIDLIVPEGKTEEEFAYEVKAECDRVGLPICNYTISADLLNREIGPEVERIKKKLILRLFSVQKVYVMMLVTSIHKTTREISVAKKSLNSKKIIWSW